MRLGKHRIFRVSVLGLLSGLTLTTSAQAQWRDDRHGPVWRDDARGAHSHRRQLPDRSLRAPGRWDYSSLLLGVGTGPGVHRGASAARGTRRSGRGAGRLATAAATGSGVGRATSVNADGKNN